MSENREHTKPLTKVIEDLLNASDEGWTVSRMAEEMGVEERKASASMSYLYCRGRADRIGHAGNYTYFRISNKAETGDEDNVSDLPDAGDDPLEVLLNAMAQAEPIIRKMIKARKMLTE